MRYGKFDSQSKVWDNEEQMRNAQHRQNKHQQAGRMGLICSHFRRSPSPELTCLPWMSQCPEPMTLWAKDTYLMYRNDPPSLEIERLVRKCRQRIRSVASCSCKLERFACTEDTIESQRQTTGACMHAYVGMSHFKCPCSCKVPEQGTGMKERRG